jgi:hypothetical protein
VARNERPQYDPPVAGQRPRVTTPEHPFAAPRLGTSQLLTAAGLLDPVILSLALAGCEWLSWSNRTNPRPWDDNPDHSYTDCCRALRPCLVFRSGPPSPPHALLGRSLAGRPDFRAAVGLTGGGYSLYVWQNGQTGQRQVAGLRWQKQSGGIFAP